MRERRERGMTRREVVGGAMVAGSWAVTGLPVVGPSMAIAQGRTRSPAIGVNVGYGLRVEDAGADVAAFEKVIGRQVDYIVDSGARESWKEAITSATHSLRTWRSVAVGSRRRLLWSQPLTMRETPLAEVAAGRHDAALEAIAVNLRNNGFYDAVVNLGPDMTASWVPWSVTPETKAAYVGAWRRAAAVFKKVSPSFRMCWSPWRNGDTLAPEEAYPGDSHVDLVGMSVLVADVPTGPGAEDYFRSHVVGHGSAPEAGRQPHGLAWIAEFGKAHAKRLIIPEAAVAVTLPPGEQSGAKPLPDDDVLVTRLAEWILQNDVALHCWRDLPATEAAPLHSRISRASPITGLRPQFPLDERPLLAAAFRKAWGSHS